METYGLSPVTMNEVLL